MRCVAGFQLQAQVAAGDIHIAIAAVMLYADNVGAAAADDFADVTQLAGTVGQSDNQVGTAAAGNLAAGDDTREDIYVDIAAGNEADGFLAFDRKLVE